MKARTDAVEEGIIEKEGGLVYGARWSLYSQVQNYLGESGDSIRWSR